MARNVISRRFRDSVSAGVSAFRSAWGAASSERPARPPRTWPPSAPERERANASQENEHSDSSDPSPPAKRSHAVAGVRTGKRDPSRSTTVHPGSLGVLSDDVNPQRVNDLRFALVEQRLAVISERLELMNERLALVSPQKSSGSKRGAHKISKEPTSDDAASAKPSQSDLKLGVDEAFANSALRPPRVPSDLTLNQAPVATSGIKTKATRRQVGPTLTGTVSGVSLGSLFNLFELERCGGVFLVRHEQQHLELTLREGAVIRCHLNGERVSPVDGVRRAFLWPTCSFSFRRDDVDEESEPPQSVNTVMLEAMRHNDEAARAG